MKIETRTFLQQAAVFWIMLMVAIEPHAANAEAWRAQDSREIESECAKVDPSRKSQEFFKCRDILAAVGSTIKSAGNKAAAIIAFPEGSFGPLVIGITRWVLDCTAQSGGYKVAAFRMSAAAQFLKCIEPAAEMARRDLTPPAPSSRITGPALISAPEDGAESLRERNLAYERDTDAMIARHRLEAAQDRAEILQEELLESARAQTEELRRIRERLQY